MSVCFYPNVHRFISASTLNPNAILWIVNINTYILKISNKTVKIRKFKTLPSHVMKNDPDNAVKKHKN